MEPKEKKIEECINEFFQGYDDDDRYEQQVPWMKNKLRSILEKYIPQQTKSVEELIEKRKEYHNTYHGTDAQERLLSPVIKSFISDLQSLPKQNESVEKQMDKNWRYILDFVCKCYMCWKNLRIGDAIIQWDEYNPRFKCDWICEKI